MKCCLIEERSTALEQLIAECDAGMGRADTWRAAAHVAVEHQAHNLVETGCFRGGGNDGGSTLILAQLAKDLGGMLDSYELESRNVMLAQKELTRRGLNQFVRLHQGDAVRALAERHEPIDFAYLDSFDVGAGPDYSPCQRHHLAEVEAILPLMSRESAILMDDQKAEWDGGKPKLAKERLRRLQWDLVEDGYQVLFSTGNAHRLIHHRFAVLTGHLKDYAGLAARTIYHNKAQYANRHGYDLRVFRPVSGPYADQGSYTKGYSWARFAELLRLLKSGAYDWVWVCGADTLVTNQKMTLESLVEDAESPDAVAEPMPTPAACPEYVKPPPAVIHYLAPRGHKRSGRKSLIVAGESVAPIQADSYLLKASPEGIAYAEDILAQYPKYKQHFWAENQTMIDLREKHAAITRIVPQWRLNAFDYSCFYSGGEIYTKGKDCYGNRGQWQPGDFLIHWPGVPLAKRLELLQKYEPLIVR